MQKNNTDNNKHDKKYDDDNDKDDDDDDDNDNDDSDDDDDDACAEVEIVVWHADSARQCRLMTSKPW